jgi:hypothetical protein
MEDRAPPRVLALVADLIFASKIMASGKAAGVEVKIIRDPAQIAGEAGSLLLVDLNQPGTIEAAANWGNATKGSVVGFVSHVDVETVRLARASGIEKVMARSSFVVALPSLIANVANNS